ncbi:MAG: UvrB/UvrC motif-containing protein [Clostridia bacterium]|nr:UvrB/UvrC motif-containing protein [Clostridia bacterium]
MKCEKCGKREATTHFTKIVNGYKEEHYLCSECAAKAPEYKELKSNMNFGITDFLTGMFSHSSHSSLGTEQGTAVCPTCNMSYDEFLKQGKLGCGDCYTVFGNRLRRPLKQIHGTFEHIGKVPKRGGDALLLDKKISKLEAEMSSAVAKQDFEAAAKLRDEIKALKAENNKEV